MADVETGREAEGGLAESPRFQPPTTRRDFLGIAAGCAAAAAVGGATIGALRLPMPSVFPESNSQVKLGPPDTFAPGSATHLQQLGMWVFRDDEGVYAISAECTHLGCIASRDDDGQFMCPCHGSVFGPDGKVLGGPAPKGLNWLAMGLAPDGQLVVDKIKTVDAGTRFMV